MKKKPEILSPVGSPETLISAIKAGADAVYLGGKLFNARMNARNFELSDISSAVKTCHDSGVRLYVTLNTLLYDRQIEQAIKYAYSLYSAGVDALITADLGFSKELHRLLPDFELHASTQCSGHNALAAEYLANMGFSRMVCAREMSKENIKMLVEKSPIEIEAFVHGAMCVCQSGQCLMSSFIGGRSGNRGECAQPCRLPYNGSYPISLKDMCLAGHITELTDIGVSSLKIEGRMKSPEYVYAVTSVYRRLIDENRNAGKNEISKLAEVFSRNGFSDGYFSSHIDNSMLGIRSVNDKENTKNSIIRFEDVKREKTNIVLPERNGKIDGYEYIFGKGDKIKREMSARFYDADSIPDTDFFDIIYLPLDRFVPGKANGVLMPPVIFDGEIQKIREKLSFAKKNGAEHILVGNVGHIQLAKDSGFIIHGDYRLNIYNNLSSDLYREFEDVILSPELTLAQIRDNSSEKCVIVYGKIPLMTLEKRTGARQLKDRRNVVFPVLKEGKREIVVNSVPVYMADREDDLKKCGIFNRHFIFTTENKTEVLNIIKAYRSKKPGGSRIRRIK